MTAAVRIEDLPGPRALPVIGNLLDIDAASPFTGLMELAREYGPIFRLATPAGPRVILSGADLVDEVCDDTRFDKKVGAGLAAVRDSGAGAGLFTAHTDDPLWRRAHNILLSPFSLQSMQDYMPMMLDLAEQLVDKWERVNPDEEVDVPDDMTRLTLDTIALCGFGYRFNSFYRDTPHPFVSAMVRTLEESQHRSRELPIRTRLRVRAQRRQEEDQAFMNELVDQLIADRRAQGDAGETRDLLGRMLNGVDRESGERLPDDNIRAQCITFLVAGHETTSGLLSFALAFLVKHPQVVERARAEVDEVLGGTARPTFEHVHRLRYVTQVLNESLRLWPTAPGFTRSPFEDAVIGGRYAIPAGTLLTVLTPSLHRDPSVWGPDAEEFDPDHVAPERLAALGPNAFKPFGTGQRACIGRQFALQEATLVLGMLLQRFEFVDHRNYQLKIRTTLTIKPDDFRIQVRPGPTARSSTPLRPGWPRSGSRRSRPPPRRRPCSRCSGTAPRCSCCTAPTWVPPRASPPSWAGRARSAASRSPSAPSTITWTRLRPVARRSWSAPPTTACRRRTPPGSPPGCVTRRRRRTPAPAWRTPSSAVATASGPPPTRPSPPRWTPNSRRTGRGGCTRAGKATPAPISTPPTGAGTPGSGPTWRRTSGCPPTWPPRPPPGPGCRSRSSTGSWRTRWSCPTGPARP